MAYPHNILTPLAVQLAQKRMYPFVLELTCSKLEDYGEWNRHDTEDFLYVLEGQMIFYSEGYNPFTLNPGDSIYYDGRMGHACLTASGQTDNDPFVPCKCLYMAAPL